MQIEIFHDVICSFCFPMSRTMRMIAEKFPYIDIIHRSFALAWKDEDYVHLFGSRKAAKKEVLSHWQAANQLDPDHRMNIQGMAGTPFDFPLSKKPLLACCAAGQMGGQSAYWDMFDGLQEAFFVKSLNIEDQGVIDSVAQGLQLDLAQFKTLMEDPKTTDLVLKDQALAKSYRIHSVPSLMVDGTYLLTGFRTVEELTKILSDLSMGFSLKGSACGIDGCE